MSVHKTWAVWHATQLSRQVKILPENRVVVTEHRRGANGIYFHQGLSDEAINWCKERSIALPQLIMDPNTGGWIATFEKDDHAFEFKMTWG